MMNAEISSFEGATQIKPLTDASPENATNVASNEISPNDNLSKRQRRKLMKKELWLSRLPAKRAKEKLRLKLRKVEASKNNISLGPTRGELKQVKMANSPCKTKVALDFSFDDLMTDKDICKSINQTLRSYSANRRAKNPVQLYLVNLNGKSRQEIGKHNGYENWDINIHSEKYLDLLPKESLVYLTSDSDNVIERFEDNKMYIIGAFVDHNSHKGYCLDIANAHGIGHARLPIQEYMQMGSRKVLTINHVFEIILGVCNGLHWKDAFLQVLPRRKGAVSKDEDSIEENVQKADTEQS